MVQREGVSAMPLASESGASCEGVMSENRRMSRRAFLGVAAGAVAAGLFARFSGMIPSLGADGGAGSVSPGTVGSGWGEMTGAVWKVLYYEDNNSINNTWGTSSINHFWDTLVGIGRNVCGQNPSTEGTSNFNPYMTVQQAFYTAANAAIANAIRRSPQATKARVVGFALVIAPTSGSGRHNGWICPNVASFNGGGGYYWVGGDTWWSFTYDSRNIGGYNCEGYIYRPPSSSECTGTFWDMKPKGSAYADYRQKFWREEWRGDSGSDLKSIIVLAVNDYESRRVGSLEVSKISTGNGSEREQNKEFSFRVTFSGEGAPDAQNFTLKPGDKKRFEDIPDGVVATVTETTPANYDVTLVPADGKVTIKADETVYVKSTNTHQTGSLEIYKVLTGNGGVDTHVFVFDVELRDSVGELVRNTTYGGHTFNANGICTVRTSVRSSPHVLNDLPTGFTYKITEHEDPDYWLISKTGDTGTIGKSPTVMKSYWTNKRKVGYATIEKRLDM